MLLKSMVSPSCGRTVSARDGIGVPGGRRVDTLCDHIVDVFAGRAVVDTWVKGIDAITLFVEDLAAAKQFYSEVFLLPLHYEDPHSAVFKFGETVINLLVITQADELISPADVAPRDAGSRMVFTIGVDDVDAMCEMLTTRGVEFINGPMDRPWGIRTASFADPGGYIWEIAQVAGQGPSAT